MDPEVVNGKNDKRFLILFIFVVTLLATAMLLSLLFLLDKKVEGRHLCSIFRSGQCLAVTTCTATDKL